MSATHQTIRQMARGACLHISTSSDWSLRQSPYRDCFCHSQTFGQTASFKANRVIFGCPADLIGAAVRRCRSGRTADRLCPQQQFVAAVRGSVLSRIRHGGNRPAASYLSPEGNRYARVSPASGFWLLFLRAHFMSRMGWSGCVPVRFTGRAAGHCRITSGRAAFLRPLGQHLIHERISKPRGQLLERSGTAYSVGIGIACGGDRSGYSAGACLPSLGRVAGFRS